MALPLQRQFQVVDVNQRIDTYTLAEAVEIARRLSADAKSELWVYDANQTPQARVFYENNQSYVDYYLTERIALCEVITQGKPRIASTRIPVSIILDYLAQGVSVDELTSDDYYPELTIDDVLACVAYARSVIEQRSF